MKSSQNLQIYHILNVFLDFLRHFPIRYASHIKKGCWLQHRAHTLALWIMFIMTVPQFADRLAPVPTTHNPKAFFAVSFLSLVVNAAAVIYQFSVIRKNKLNPFKDEIYTDKAFYKKINAENK